MVVVRALLLFMASLGQSFPTWFLYLKRDYL